MHFPHSLALVVAIAAVHPAQGASLRLGSDGEARAAVVVATDATEVERRAVIDSAQNAGAREVYLVAEPIAAAIGVGLPVDKPSGNMVIDIGGGTTEIAVIALNGIVTDMSIRVGGDKMDEVIVQHIKKAYNLLIGDQTAEHVKKVIGSATNLGQ